ncbi:MAG TPA: MFS transporter [Polyangiaceae bacterium]|jgi:GPH family glycoside/pentoside/hexuronide:cation symporter
MIAINSVLSRREKLGYALGDSASNFYWKVLEFFALFFYTDVFGISPGAAGTLFLIARAWDAVFDPVMGAIADRTHTRWGSFRPYLVWFALPIALAGVAMFTSPHFSEHGKLIYAYATYIIFYMLYSAINIPYSALMGVITPRTNERAELASYRFIGAFAVALIVQTFTPKLARIFGGDSAQRGWQLVLASYGVIAALLFVLCFSTTRERMRPPREQRASVKADLSALLVNRPWIVMFGLGTLVIAGFALRGGTLYYYFKYYLRDENAFVAFMFSGGIAALAGTALMPFGSRRLGKRRLYFYCMAGAALLTLPYYFLRPEERAAIYGLNAAIAFLLGPTPALMFAMFADTADYGEWKTGRRTTGFVMAAAMLSLKLGGALGGAANGWILEAYGFSANHPQSARAERGILLLMGVVPAASCALAALLSRLYRLDERLLMQIEQELEARRHHVSAHDSAPQVAA